MSETTTRRGFLNAAGAAAVAGTATLALGDDMPPVYDGEIVDTHLHLWDLKLLNLPWVDSSTGRAREILGHDHLLSDYAEATRGLKVTKAVYMEVDVAESDEVKEAEYVTRICREGKSPMVAAVISGRPASDGFGDYLDQFKGNPYIKGLRQVLHSSATTPKFCLDPAFVRGMKILGERGLCFDLCLKNDQLEYAAELIEQCPDTRFVIDHCGNPHAGSNDMEGWRRGLAKIAGLKDRQVICKISGIYGNVQADEWPAEKIRPIVRSVIDLFGWDRVIFAGDWPVVNLGASFRIWVETLKTLVRADRPEDQAKLFRKNAIRFYDLKKG
ncbi:amidohydrolase family protein [Tundrisphaera lichenicola]|uniref:amidohydrolase family protein n=1 Tax=Tundrisphaera lichenicola TaxID=2029860 RepID=UPI003EC15589